MNWLINGKEADILMLHIKTKWFQMILSGEKTEEYREIKQFYRSRFRKFGFLKTDGESPTLSPQYVLFRNGYSAEDSPHFVAKCVLTIGTGIPDWGAVPGEEYYKLNILEVIKEGKENQCKMNS